MGLAFAKEFANEGAAVILTDIDEAGLQRTAATLRERGATCSTHVLDLSSEGAIAAFALGICREFPRLDVLVNNAGLAYGEVATGFEKLSQEKWLRYFAV